MSIIKKDIIIHLDPIVVITEDINLLEKDCGKRCTGRVSGPKFC